MATNHVYVHGACKEPLEPHCPKGRCGWFICLACRVVIEPKSKRLYPIYPPAKAK